MGGKDGWRDRRKKGKKESKGNGGLDRGVRDRKPG